MADEPTVTLVVCSRNRAEHLRRMVPHLVAAVGSGDQAVIVDSASSTSATRDVARAAGLECVRVDRPGLSRARNAGTAWSTADIIAFTDDDCMPGPDWADQVRASFADPAVGFVTGRVDSEADATSAVSTIDRDTVKKFVGPQDPYGMGHGANMAFRRELLNGLGGFDEELGAGAPFHAGEDMDMLYRVLADGQIGMYNPAVTVVHDQWREGGDLLRLNFGYGVGAGAAYVKAARADTRAARLLVRAICRQAAIGLAHAALKQRSLASVAWVTASLVGLAVGVARGARHPLKGPVYAVRG